MYGIHDASREIIVFDAGLLSFSELCATAGGKADTVEC